MSNTPTPTTEPKGVEKLAFELEQILPESFVKDYKEGKITDPNAAIEALNGHYKKTLHAQGWADPQEVQTRVTGAHNSFQTKLKSAVLDLVPDADFSTAKNTDEVLQAGKSYLANLKKAQGEKGEKTPEEAKKEAAQLKQLIDELARLKAAHEEEKKELSGKVEEANGRYKMHVETGIKKQLLGDALNTTKDKRIAGVSDKTIETLFYAEHDIDLQRNEQGEIENDANGKPLYRVVEKGTGKIVIDPKDGQLPLPRVVENLYRNAGFFAAQPQSNAGQGGGGKEQVKVGADSGLGIGARAKSVIQNMII